MKCVASASAFMETARNHSFSFIVLMATNGPVKAKELRSIVDQEHDPRLTKYRESGEELAG
jgi:hypothetical protein